MCNGISKRTEPRRNLNVVVSILDEAVLCKPREMIMMERDADRPRNNIRFPLGNLSDEVINGRILVV
ncbi:hypothetical protein C482_13995 [Natrialba chahannaoensis JCM 10990]|uniref:Uncharacterized protein n=1 Tax=Natrialba chahannaoensis JCM 10990 TaxID=1227492 RepID=M0AFS5_9EURY|nr:hypothetical protein C482_13995 [Natrialba chahannaoensis JCM 10990]